MKHIKHLFAVCLLLLVATTATAQSQSDNTQTKAVSATKADVNGDGVVNEADIEEILAIMQQENGTKYYWYAGWTEPSADPSSDNYIGKIINEIYPATNNDSTEHIAGGSTNDISTINADYSDNKLFDNSALTSGVAKNYYVVVPQGCKIYNTIGNPSTAFNVHSTEIANHTVYISKSVSAFINAIKIY